MGKSTIALSIVHDLVNRKPIFGEFRTNGIILNVLRRLAYEYDCTIILIHHLRKNLPYVVEDIDELRGSSALVNEPDLVYVFQQDKTTENVI